MRNAVSIIVIAAAASLIAPGFASAQNGTDSPRSPQSHVQQHQEATPGNAPQGSTAGGDQSAEAPQSPAVIPPPATGDQSVIKPPANGAAKTPVIPPPGSPGNNGTVQPK